MAPPKSPLDELRIERRPVRRSPRWAAWLVLVGIVALILMGAVIWQHSRADAIPVQTAEARAAGADDADSTVLNASGYVVARREATVSSKVTGKVTEVLFEEGDKVKADQVLARLDDSDERAQLAVAQAQLDATRAAVDETRALLKQANEEFQRITNLASQHVASDSDLDKAESDARALDGRLTRQQLDIIVARRQVDLWEQQMDDYVIRAPFDGVITTKDAQPGEIISPISAGGGFTRTGIGTVVDMSSLEIEIDVNESYINRVQPGQVVEATLDAYPGWKIPCKVIAIIPTADREKSTVKVRIAFDHFDPRILPEMSVKVAFEDAGAPATGREVLVPKDAVCSRDGRDVVFVVSDGRADRRAVTVSDTQDDNSVLSAGVNAGEEVVVNPPDALTDGAPVKEESL